MNSRMKGFAGLCLALLAAVATSLGEARGQDRLRASRDGSTMQQPYELVRGLEALQDRVVQGDSEAQARLPKLLGRIGADILAAEPKAWEDPRNLRAVIVYGASGGQPRVLRAVVEAGAAGGEIKALLEGTLAYIEGRDDRARQALLPIDARTLPAPLAGHVALIQANLVAGEDPRKAMQLLSRARILAAGTLVEEAALRKEIFLADQVDDLETFAGLSGQYIRRFGKSAYAENFRQRFRSAVTRFGLTSEPSRFARLESALAVLDPEEQLQLFLATARAGLLGGRIESARRAATKAIGLARAGSVEASRSALYAAVTRVLSGDIESGLAELGSVEARQLAKPDADLGQTIVAIASEIRAEPDAQRSSSDVPPKPGGDTSADQLLHRAETVLDEVGALLERKGF